MTPSEAELYALIHDGAPGDVAFYRAQTRGASRVLELGCGWGRVASQLECSEVIGLEHDSGMRALGAARHADLSILDGDMRAFALGSFDRIIVPFTGIYCLPTEEDVSRCLGCVRASLAPEGRFIFDAYAADTFHDEARPEDYPEDHLDEVARIDHGGEPLIVYERSRWDRDAQRMDATYVYQTEDAESRAEITVGHRYLLRAQLDPLLGNAGLRITSLWGSFDGDEYDGSGSLIVVAACA